MISLSIFSDFCTWWPLWWIAPFILGLVLGSSIWGRYKKRVGELEDELRRSRTEIHNINSALNYCNSKRDEDSIIISEQLRELTATKKQLSLLVNQKPAVSSQKLASKVTPVQEKVDLNVVDKDNEPIVDNHKSSKGDYNKLHKSNLQIIEGIGPKLESVLKENGIKKWSDLSSRSYGELRAILDKYGGRYAIVDPTTWPKQATLAKKEKWQKLMDFQGDDGSGSKLKKILKKLDIL